MSDRLDGTFWELLERYAKSMAVGMFGDAERVRVEMENRWKIARQDHPIMWEAHLNRTEHSRGREDRVLAEIVDKREAQRERAARRIEEAAERGGDPAIYGYEAL